MFPLLALIIIFLWDGYFFINYLISFFKSYKISEWSPRVSLLIPAYNEGGSILKAIESALTQNYPNFEVIVVDDGSEDGTYEKAVFISDPRLRVFRMPHGGKARALNFGLSRATGEIIVTIDADSVLEEGALSELISRFYSDDVLGVGGQVRVLGGGFLERAQDVEHLRIAMFRRAKELDNLSVAPGPISAFRKDALERIGGFVEDTVEDYATTKRLRESGKVVYAPRARIWTKMPNDLGMLWRQRKRWFLGDLRHLGDGLTKGWLFLLLGDTVAFFDIALPFSLISGGRWFFLAFWYAFEVVTMLLPTLIEGGPILDAMVFPPILWFWALFYLILHLYGYGRLLVRAL
ncbi:glycosyltransferase family 2 protein [Thermococcus sp.]|uniref:glycosyltransferase n=1 Tax=Thermococcus sp. TaxID=35749 RepID=UPI0025EAB225|nr:glycosyltransferase [Thermococcus sp.]